ncbi:MAG: hypothetical protein ABIP06_04315 [Pyrinomonadaceae bacterium]
MAVFAQTAPVIGKVELKKADGTTEPVQGALVEVYRTDIKGKGPTDKTNKKGEFSFAGLQLGATFVFSVSGQTISPTYLPNIKAGNDKLVITVSEGNGKKLTEDEVRTALTSGPPASATSEASSSKELTAEQKKAQEEQAKVAAEITKKNEKIQNSNTVIDKALKDGNQAFGSKNYDVAIAKYDEGIQASPTFVGSAPVLLNNKASALGGRGVDLYNQTVKMTDASAKSANYTKITKDFGDAVEAYNTSWTILKSASAEDVKDQQSYQANKIQALSGLRDVVKYMIQTEKVSPDKVPEIAALLAEYAAIETDAAKKSEAEVYLADIYRITGDSPNAIIEYKKVLEKSPTNVDALAGLGLSQANAGYNADGTINDAMMQEAINNLQRFTEVAPENHKLKASVKETVDYLKTQNFKPQKTATKKKN